jgi:proteasome accessory factor C
VSPETAERRLNRLVQLVAEGTRHGRRVPEGVPLEELADELGMTRAQLLAEVRLLTEAGDDPATTWLSSLSAFQEGDRLSIQSRGPYRRPIRLTADELLALRIALATETVQPSPVLAALAEWEGVSAPHETPAVRPVPFLGGSEPATVDLARTAMNKGRKLAIVYAGEGATEATKRVVQVHDVVLAEGVAYLSAWCELRHGWRRFRADRILDVELRRDTFERRDDAPAIATREDLFVPPAEVVDAVKVRFSGDVARWVRERYVVEDGPDGSVVVTVRTVSVDWLVRMVLHYGDAAEVLEPPAYREAMRRAVA